MPDDIFQIAGQAVAAENPRERRAQDARQDVGTAGRRNAIHHERAGDDRPQPPFVAVGAVSRLIGVEDRFVLQGRVQFGIRRRDRGTRLFPRVLRTALTDRDLQRAFEQPLHDQARQATDNRQIGNQRRELRAKLTLDVRRQRRLRRLTARGTHEPMAAVFGDVRLDGRQFRDLMPPRVADQLARPRRKCMLAIPTRVREEVHHRVYALDGQQWPRMPRMARLTARFASTLLAPAARALLARKSIR